MLYLEDFSLTPFVALGWVEPLSDFAPAGAIDALEKQMTPSFVSAWTVNGDRYALPYYRTVWLPIYNKDIFAKAGSIRSPILGRASSRLPSRSSKRGSSITRSPCRSGTPGRTSTSCSAWCSRTAEPCSTISSTPSSISRTPPSATP